MALITGVITPIGGAMDCSEKGVKRFDSAVFLATPNRASCLSDKGGSFASPISFGCSRNQMKGRGVELMVTFIPG